MKKYDFSMKKYDFLPSTAQLRAKKHPPFLQDFCKNAQWRAKKLRERGSSTARPTEKGVGGSPDSVASCRFRRVDSVGFVVSRRADSVGFVAICRLPLGVSS